VADRHTINLGVHHPLGECRLLFQAILQSFDLVNVLDGGGVALFFLNASRFHLNCNQIFTLSSLFGLFPGLSSFLGRTLGVKRQQSPLGNHQIDQAERRVQLSRVLGQAPVTNLLVVEQVLQDVEGVFYPPDE
jgi:hypothetical protein